MARILKPVLRPHPQADEPLRELINQLNDTFAREVTKAGNIEDGAVGTAALADDAVTSDKIAAGAVETTDLADDAVTDAKLRESAALSVIANGTNATANPTDVAAGTDGHVLRRSGTTLGFGEIATAGIADDAVTGDKIANDAVGADQVDATETIIVGGLTVDASAAAVVKVDRGLVAQGAYTEYLSAESPRARCGLVTGNSQHYSVKVSSNSFATEFDALRIDNSNGHTGLLATPDGSYSLYVGGGASFQVADPSTDQAWNVIDSGASGVTNVIGYTTGEAVLIGTGGADVQARGANFRPDADNTQNLGTASRRWAEVFAATGTINTSDERWKLDIADCDLGLTFINALRPVRYRMKEGRRVGVRVDENDEIITEEKEGVRTHYGLVAQQVREALDGFGKSHQDFAGWTLDDKNDPNSRQGLRYTELIGPLISAVQELSRKIEDLEGRLANAV